MEVKFDTMLPLRDKELHVKIKDRPYHMNVIILTDTGSKQPILTYCRKK